MRYFIEAKRCQTGAEIVEDNDGDLWRRCASDERFYCSRCCLAPLSAFVGFLRERDGQLICDECFAGWLEKEQAA